MKILFINPPIYDFSAYDLWSKPLGFLKIIDLFVKNGVEIFYFDFLNRNHKFYENLKVKKGKYGCGSYYYEIIEKPEIYKNIPRRYKRFGLPKEIFLNYIENVGNLDFIFITTGMTYWVLGIKETIDIIKKFYPKTPVILGGIYATFCYYDAKNLNVDFIFRGKNIYSFFLEFQKNFKIELKFPDEIKPYWNIYEKLDYLVVKTSYGCPFSCWYCGIKQLEPEYFKLDHKKIVEELSENIEKFKTNDVAFYDDALLYDFENHLYKILFEITQIYKHIRFHTPNGIHPKFLNRDVAQNLKEMNFKTINLSLETIDKEREKESGYKVNFKDFESAIKNLVDAGFTKEEIGVYILAGLPAQSPKEVLNTVKILKNYPCKIKLAEYSPIPGTIDYEIAKKLYRELPIENPLFQNNSIYPLWNFENKWEIINLIKKEIKT
ncbi:MAG: radical SAM protein [Candidatus Omnitrophica bacterium]|nr:radical SAM protein [Candidatus Omnitrophota bacterium]MCM8806754.1 radical SAM protein [Candidatus Omnitrophota bacterium]